MLSNAAFYSNDAPTRAELRAESAEAGICPFCDNEICTDETACDEAAEEYWADQATMHARGK